MACLRRFCFKLLNLLHPARAEQDLAREIDAHLVLLQDEFRRRGMDADEARLAAMRAYGGIEQAKELHREERSWVWLEQVRQDLRFSARSLLKSPGFAVTAILTLALGTGANTAIFSLIDALMLKALPVHHPEQLIQVNMAGRDIWGIEGPFVSNPVWERVRDRNDVFNGVFGYAVARFDLSTRGEARYVQGKYVSGQFFDTLGLGPKVGRVITASDDRRECPGTAVLSYGFWQHEYGGRADVVGANISLNSHPFEIIGVIGPGFTRVDVGRKSDIYVPLCAQKIIGGENGLLDGRRGGWLRVIGCPNPNLAIHQVEARLKTLVGSIMEETVPPNIRPEQTELYLKRSFEVRMASTGLSSIRSKYGHAFIILMALIGAILLIACNNIGNLLLARGAARRHEIAIRMALGSGSGRLIRQLLSENLILSLLGAGFGLALAQWGARMLVGLLVSNVYQENEVFLDTNIDLRVLAFTAGIAILATLLFGLIPAWRVAHVDPQSAARTNARDLTQDRKLRLGKALVVVQMAVSLVLIACAGLLLETFLRLETLDPGFEPTHVLLMDFDLGKQAPSPAQRGVIFDTLLDHFRTLPWVRSASISGYAPLGGAVGMSYLQIENSVTENKDHQLVFKNEVSEKYFETLGVRLVAGRNLNFHSRDTPGAETTTINLCN